MKKTLILVVKKKWFDKIKSGMKKVDYRLMKPYWSRRLVGKDYDQIVVTLGYPKRDDHARRIIFPYRGWSYAYIKHEIWGGGTHNCFAIKLEGENRESKT